MSVGYDHIDTSACKQLGIALKNTPDVLTEATSELAIALVLATLRKIIPSANAVKNGAWGAWSPTGMCGRSLVGTTVGIVGLGRIGMDIAKKLRVFGVSRVLYTARQQKNVTDAEFLPIQDLVAKSDVVIIACALNSETKQMFDKALLMQMKPDAALINIARGGILNQLDLIDVLRQGHLGAVGLDVCDPEPMNVDNPLLKEFGDKVLILPHIGSATLETREAMASLALDQILTELKIQ
jgi:glyoxylate/hydroxypyruvate reductase